MTTDHYLTDLSLDLRPLFRLTNQLNYLTHLNHAKWYSLHRAFNIIEKVFIEINKHKRTLNSKDIIGYIGEALVYSYLRAKGYNVQWIGTRGIQYWLLHRYDNNYDLTVVTENKEYYVEVKIYEYLKKRNTYINSKKLSNMHNVDILCITEYKPPRHFMRPLNLSIVELGYRRKKTLMYTIEWIYLSLTNHLTPIDSLIE